MRDAGRRVLSLVLLAGLMVVAGCRKEQIPPAPQWDAGPVDGGGLDYTDSDHDGVCDRTELARGLDPSNADTDGDTFPDGVEVRFGFDAARPSSPDRDILVYLSEAPLASASMPVALTVRGSGETFIGAYQSLPVADPEDASGFFSRAIAAGANPMSNVYAILADEQKIQRVIGTTELYYDVTFVVPAMEELRGCTHAFPWRYQVKRDDGVLVFARRYILIVTPNASRPDLGAWCASTDLCI